MQWRIQHILKVKYAKMVTNLLKDYIVINQIVKQKIKIQYVQTKMRKDKIFTQKRMSK